MKPRLAFFSFTSCEGCQLQVLNLESELPDLLELVEIVNFREAISEKREDYEIAFVEGSISRAEEEAELRQIRERARVLVATGACAHLGGVNLLRNKYGSPELYGAVYGGQLPPPAAEFSARPVEACVKADYALPGCPIDKYEFLRLVQGVVLGREFRLPDFPVCVECKLNETRCVYRDGQLCLGPISRAGCRALCTRHGSFCAGCRGLIGQMNLTSLREMMGNFSFSEEELREKLELFNLNAKEVREWKKST